jgi:hypothetical protein
MSLEQQFLKASAIFSKDIAYSGAGNISLSLRIASTKARYIN